MNLREAAHFRRGGWYAEMSEGRPRSLTAFPERRNPLPHEVLMRFRNVLIALAVLLVALVAGAVIYLKSIDVNQYRSTIAEAAKAATGRKLTLGGPLSLELGWTGPAVVAERVSFANAPWGSRPEMARLERLEAQVALLPLLRGEIRLSRLVLVKPDILLETGPKGQANWKFGEEGGGGEGGAALPVTEGVRVRIQKAKLAFRDGRTGRTYRLAIDEMVLKPGGDGLGISLKGTAENLPVTLEGTTGPLTRLTTQGAMFPVELTADVGGVRAKLSGRVRDLLLPGRYVHLKVSVAAKDLGALKDWMGAAAAGLRDLSLKADLGAEGPRFLVKNLKLRADGSDLSGQVHADASGKKPMVKADLRSSRLDLTQLMAGEKAKKPTAGGKIFSREPLPLGALSAAEVEVHYAAKELVTPTVRLHDLDVTLTLHKGRLSVKPLTARMAEGRMEGELGLDAARRPPEAALLLKVQKASVGQLLKEAGLPGLAKGRVDFEARLRGRGKSVAAIMASLDGQTKLLMGKGEASTAGLDVAIGGLRQVVGTLLSRRAATARINCAASNFVFKNGVGTSRLTLVDSEYSTIAGKGSVNLGRETLNLTITPESKSATLNVAIPVKVGGTLASPTFRPDELAAARKIGGLVSLFVFPPAAVVALGDLGTNGNACLQIAKGGARPAGTEKKEESPVQAVGEKAEKMGKKAAESVSEGVKSLGKGIQNLFGK